MTILFDSKIYLHTYINIFVWKVSKKFTDSFSNLKMAAVIHDIMTDVYHFSEPIIL